MALLPVSSSIVYTLRARAVTARKAGNVRWDIVRLVVAVIGWSLLIGALAASQPWLALAVVVLLGSLVWQVVSAVRIHTRRRVAELRWTKGG